jgi:AbrB family looped-hinge helix DNA binding protein
MNCCRIEAIISVDERGQMVLPKDVREKAKIKPGDKMAVITWEKEGEVCCITLIKAEELTDVVKEVIAPLLRELDKSN